MDKPVKHPAKPEPKQQPKEPGKPKPAEQDQDAGGGYNPDHTFPQT